MRISDWSSDVCSSDLASGCDRILRSTPLLHRSRASLPAHDGPQLQIRDRTANAQLAACQWHCVRPGLDRTRVEEGKSVSVRVNLGGSRIIKTKNTTSNRRQETTVKTQHSTAIN